MIKKLTVRKKLILSTFFATSVVTVADSFAAIPNISYNQNNKFAVNGQEFANYGDVKRHFENQARAGAISEQEIRSGHQNISKDSWSRLINHSLSSDSAVGNVVYLHNKSASENTRINVAEYKKLAEAIRTIESNTDFNFQQELSQHLASRKAEDVLSHLYDSADDITELAELLSTTTSRAKYQDRVDKMQRDSLQYGNEAVETDIMDITDPHGMKYESFEISTSQGSSKVTYIGSDRKRIEHIKKLISKKESIKSLLLGQQYIGKQIDDELRSSLLDYIGDPKTAKEEKDIKPLARPDNYTTHGVMASSEASAAVVGARLSGFGSGAAAGSMFQKFGAWVKGTMSRGEQKTYALEPGYKFDQTGGTIGVDAGDEYIIGIAYSLFNNNVKSKRASDTKEKVTTHIGTIYGLVDLGSLYINGQVHGGASDIKKDRYSGDLDNHVARGKTTGRTYGGKVEIGYNYVLSGTSAMLTPSIAVSHNDVKVKGYKEKGLGLNRKIGDRSSSRTDGIVGLTAKHLVNTGGMVVFPEIHAFVSQSLNSKNSATKIHIIDGIDPIVTPGQKLTKTHYKLGAVLNMQAQDSVEASIGYDYGMAKKFQSHTGMVKLRVSF